MIRVFTCVKCASESQIMTTETCTYKIIEGTQELHCVKMNPSSTLADNNTCSKADKKAIIQTSHWTCLQRYAYSNTLRPWSGTFSIHFISLLFGWTFIGISVCKECICVFSHLLCVCISFVLPPVLFRVSISFSHFVHILIMWTKVCY